MVRDARQKRGEARSRPEMARDLVAAIRLPTRRAGTASAATGSRSICPAEHSPVSRERGAIHCSDEVGN